MVKSDEAAQAKTQPRKIPPGEPRLVCPQREGVARIACEVDRLIAADHEARAVWKLVEQLDLSGFEESIRARGSHPGRPATDPRVLVALWIYATLEGVSEARELDRFCRYHQAYQWICGGVPVDYHLLSDFRVKHREALENLMSQVLAVLDAHGLVDLSRTAQDGMRVRASAGASSFRREASLQKSLEVARQRVKEIGQEASGRPDSSPRECAAQERAAREREERIQRALEELPKVREAKKPEEKSEARASTTDPQARVMKMANGGFNPAYNVQLSVDTKTRAIVEASVTNSGSDMGQTEPMLSAIQQRHGTLPDEHLVDGGFAKKESIQQAAQQGVTIYAPVKKPTKDGVDPYEPKPQDSPEVGQWRQRMGTPQAKEIYRQRGATVETANGDLREHRGLDRIVVRGLPKALCVVLWAAITYNVHLLIGAGLLGGPGP